VARTHGLPVPEWALSHLDQVAASLDDIFEREMNERSAYARSNDGQSKPLNVTRFRAALAQALSMSQPGRDNIFERASKRGRDRLSAAMVDRASREHPTWNPYQHVATEQRLATKKRSERQLYRAVQQAKAARKIRPK